MAEKQFRSLSIQEYVTLWKQLGAASLVPYDDHRFNIVGRTHTGPGASFPVDGYFEQTFFDISTCIAFAEILELKTTGAKATAYHRKLAATLTENKRLISVRLRTQSQQKVFSGNGVDIAREAWASIRRLAEEYISPHETRAELKESMKPIQILIDSLPPSVAYKDIYNYFAQWFDEDSANCLRTFGESFAGAICDLDADDDVLSEARKNATVLRTKLIDFLELCLKDETCFEELIHSLVYNGGRPKDDSAEAAEAFAAHCDTFYLSTYLLDVYVVLHNIVEPDAKNFAFLDEASQRLQFIAEAFGLIDQWGDEAKRAVGPSPFLHRWVDLFQKQEKLESKQFAEKGSNESGAQELDRLALRLRTCSLVEPIIAFVSSAFAVSSDPYKSVLLKTGLSLTKMLPKKVCEQFNRFDSWLKAKTLIDNLNGGRQVSVVELSTSMSEIACIKGGSDVASDTDRQQAIQTITTAYNVSFQHYRVKYDMADIKEIFDELNFAFDAVAAWDFTSCKWVSCKDEMVVMKTKVERLDQAQAVVESAKCVADSLSATLDWNEKDKDTLTKLMCFLSFTLQRVDEIRKLLVTIVYASLLSQPRGPDYGTELKGCHAYATKLKVKRLSLHNTLQQKLLDDDSEQVAKPTPGKDPPPPPATGSSGARRRKITRKVSHG